jgi:hypothetical protein
MSVAIPVESGDVPVTVMPGVVVVMEFGFAHFAAMCSCGWAGRRRFLCAPANIDAWEHAMRDKCDVSVPLVMRAAC